jgi:predicted HicB family RNase H-like nuclease
MPMPKPKKPGRPSLPKGHAKVGTLRVRVTPEELKKLNAVAKARKQTVSEFIRGTLSSAMEA